MVKCLEFIFKNLPSLNQTEGPFFGYFKYFKIDKN
jgi:hypothetical protein